MVIAGWVLDVARWKKSLIGESKNYIYNHDLTKSQIFFIIIVLNTEAKTMKTCSKCGFQNADNTKFCVNCGNGLDVAVQPMNACPNCGFQNIRDAKFCVGCGFKLDGASMKTCPNCGFQNKSDAKFCVSCATSLDLDSLKECPNCGYHNKEDAKFCVSCATSLDLDSLKECPNCGYHNKEDAKFCVGCGNDLSVEMKVCPECGHQNKEGMKFCVNCGNKLEGEASNKEIAEDESPQATAVKENVDDAAGSDEEIAEESEEEVFQDEMDEAAEEETEEETIDSTPKKGNTCPKCGRDNLEGIKFCIGCGTPLEKIDMDEDKADVEETETQSVDEEDESVEEDSQIEIDEDKADLPVKDEDNACPECGHVNAEGINFCIKCGTKLEKAEIGEDKAEIEETETQSVDDEDDSNEDKSSGEDSPVKDEGDACPECGHVNAEGTNFCISCGTELINQKQAEPQTNDNACPKCGHVNAEGTNFCINCGNKLDSVQSDVSQANGNDKKVCPKCGHENDYNYKYCKNCNLPLNENGETLDDKIEELRSEVCSFHKDVGSDKIELQVVQFYKRGPKNFLVHSKIPYSIDDTVSALKRVRNVNPVAIGDSNKFKIIQYGSFKNIHLFLDEDTENETIVQYFMEDIRDSNSPPASILLDTSVHLATKREAKVLMKKLVKELEKSNFQ